MTRFSANLGFLWTDRSLTDAIHAAKLAGFDAVEFHWPFDTPAREVKKALEETNLPLLGLNTVRGNWKAGELGLAALPGRQSEALDAIEKALDYATEVGAKAVHVMAGIGEGPEAETTFIENISAGCEIASRHGVTILIEPLNAYDAPGYFLHNTEQAKALIEQINMPNLKLMFDCYHVGRTELDVATTLTKMLPWIGHVQIAAVPDRGAPDHGEVDYGEVFALLQHLGWDQPLGVEYKPDGDTQQSLSWMSKVPLKNHLTAFARTM